MDFFFDNLEGRLSSTLPHYDRPDGDEQDCRKRSRDTDLKENGCIKFILFPSELSPDI